MVTQSKLNWREHQKFRIWYNLIYVINRNNLEKTCFSSLKAGDRFLIRIFVQCGRTYKLRNYWEDNYILSYQTLETIQFFTKCHLNINRKESNALHSNMLMHYIDLLDNWCWKIKVNPSNNHLSNNNQDYRAGKVTRCK